MEGLAAFGAAFALVALLELGDKTQLLVISLAAKHPPLPVAMGAFLGEASVTAIAVTIGIAIASVVDVFLLQLASGAIFIVLGVWNLRPKGAEEAESVEVSRPFVNAAGLAFLAELGDKTMLAVIALSGALQAPASVFLGASIALLGMILVAIAVGRVLRRFLTARWLQLVSAATFIVAGVLVIAEALLSG